MNSPSRPIKNAGFRTKELVQTALMGTILFVAQVVFAGLPNIELVSLLLILYTLTISPKQALAAAYLFALLEGLVYGFGLWWAMYLYVWPALVLIAWLFRRNDSVWFWTLISAAFGLSFGALCSIPYAIGGGISAGVAWWISGIPYDIAHCVGNAVVMVLLYKPMTCFFRSLQSRWNHS
ncbi:MAG: hypothetical protein ACOX64_06175 [Candidatus Merdivicinus sp.]